MHDLDELASHLLVELWGVQVDDPKLVLQIRVIQPEVETATLQSLGQLAGVVGGEEHDGERPGLNPAELRDRDLEVREQLEQHGLEFLVGLVDLVDQEHHRVG